MFLRNAITPWLAGMFGAPYGLSGCENLDKNLISKYFSRFFSGVSGMFIPLCVFQSVFGYIFLSTSVLFAF